MYKGEHPYTKEKGFDIKKSCIEYCIRDCEIVQKFLLKIFENLKENEKKILLNTRSISSFSLCCFDKIFNNLKIETKTSIKIDKIIREAYFGGRCEVFGNKKENEKVFHFDFTGMYSEIMKEEFWFGKVKTKINPKNIYEPGFYTVEVYSKNIEIPILPFREDTDQKLLFPNGNWIGTYWYEELILFIENGGIILKIISSLEFEKKGKPFLEFVENFQKMRKKSKFDNFFWKLFINSIYGRLGMGMIDEVTEIVNEEQYWELRKKKEKKIIRESIINKLILITYEKKKSTEFINSNVAIAAMITSKARIKLYRAYKDVIKNEGRILYSDTDSIFAAFKKDVLNQKHGDVFWDESKEDTVIEDCVFAIPKGYSLKLKNNEITKLKGFSRNFIKFEEFKEIFYKEKEIQSEQINFKKAGFILKFEKIEKTATLNNYTKRKFNLEKSETSPIFITQNMSKF